MAIYRPGGCRVEYLSRENGVPQRIGSNLAPQQTRKIALGHCGRGDRVEAAETQILNDAARGCDPRSLIIAENERAILDNRSAHRGAKLILPEWRTGLAGQVLLPPVGIQLRVLQDLKQSAMNTVGARLQADIQDAAGTAPILRTVAVGKDAHFADGFDGRAHYKSGLVQEVNDVDVVVNAIEQEIVLTVGPHSIG